MLSFIQFELAKKKERNKDKMFEGDKNRENQKLIKS